MRDADTIFAGTVAVFVIAALAGDAALYGHGWRVLGFPAVVGIATATLCVLRIVRRARERLGTPPVADEPRSIWRTGLDAVAMLAILPCVQLFGLIIGLPLYVASSLRLRGEGWAVTIAAGGIVLAGATIIILLLGVPQPAGPLVWP